MKEDQRTDAAVAQFLKDKVSQHSSVLCFE
jgi:hypothetical protein